MKRQRESTQRHGNEVKARNSQKATRLESRHKIEVHKSMHLLRILNSFR